MKSDSLNVLDLIDPTSPYAIDDIKALANDIVVRTGTEHDPHWNDSAEMVIAAVIALVVAILPPEDRNLQTVAGILASPTVFADAIQAMKETGL